MPQTAGVIQGSFPNGLPRVSHASAAQPFATRATPAWVQARVGTPATPQAVQRQTAPPAHVVPANAVQVPQQAAQLAPAGGQPLPPQVRQKMEAVFGADFRDVRIHVGPQAQTLGATSFTHGSHIHFAPGQYDPHTAHGQQILGRELAHVVQQRAGRVHNPFRNGVAIVHDRALEAEAERMAIRASAAQPKTAPQRTVQMLKRINDMVRFPWEIVSPQTMLRRYAQYLFEVARERNVKNVAYVMSELLESMKNQPPTTSLEIQKIRKVMNQAVAVLNEFDVPIVYSKKGKKEFDDDEEEKPKKFVSLDDDAKNELYTLTVTPTKKIRMDSGEAPFQKYSGMTVDEAVEEAIEGLDLTGSISFKYSRHDFQPASEGMVNLQVQLGGSQVYRKGKGDTSSTVVVITEKLFQRLLKADKLRLKQVLQAAHRRSFKECSKVELK